VIEEMRLLQPSSMVQISKKNPDRFMKRALNIVKTGFGQPSIFNTDAIVQELVRQGKSLADARCGGASGCVEAGAFGREAYFLTGYFNLPKLLELTLNNGVDPRHRQPAGAGHRRAVADSAALKTCLTPGPVSLAISSISRLAATTSSSRSTPATCRCPFSLCSSTTALPMAGTTTPAAPATTPSYIQGVGLGSITDALTALKVHVFDRKTITMDGFIKVLAENFDGHDAFRRELLDDTPKYGNDDDAADDILQMVFEAYYGL
jgi:pyruvate-formate lyase